jgi:hypothetical protein
MVKYTNPELTDMVLIYREASSNTDATRRLYEGTAARKRIEPTRLQGNNHLS